MLQQIATLISIVVGLWFFGEKIYGFITRRRGPELEGTRPTRKDYVLGIALSFACAILWSLGYVSLSYLVAGVGPFTVSAAVLLGATVLLAAVGILFRLAEDAGAKPRGAEVSWSTSVPWLAVLTNALGFVLFLYALKYISASQTIALHKTNPVFVLFFAWLWGARRPSRVTISTVALVAAGAVLMTTDENFQLGADSLPLGSALAVLGGITFAAFAVSLEKSSDSGQTTSGRLLFLSLVFLFSYAVVVSFAFVFESFPDWGELQLWILLANGVRVAVVYVLFWAAVRRIGATLTSVIVALEVPLTMVVEKEFLGREPSLRLILGSLAILVGAISLIQERNPAQPGQSKP